jgi:AbiU2
MQPLPLDQQLERIGQEIVWGRLFLDLWWYFEERSSRGKIFKTMDEYSEFFRFTPHAYLVAYVIYTAGVFDESKGTSSLPRLVRDMKKAGQLKGQDAEAVDALLVEVEPIVDKVRILRNKAFAHRSAHIAYNDVVMMAAVKPTRLRELTDMALEIANRLLLARGLRRRDFAEADLPREDAEEMMRALAAKRSQR